jgi:hypothetical protein
MDRSGQLLGQHLVDHPLTLHPALVGEGGRDQRDREMALAALPRAGVARVLFGVVADVDALRREGLGQLVPDQIGHGAHQFLLSTP